MNITTPPAAMVWLLSAFAASAFGADAGRGATLYEARCDVCHGTSVHAREARKATSFDTLRRQVARWDAELGRAWSADEIDDVTVFLNQRYYKFPCPANVCGGNQAVIGAKRTTDVATK
jgi:hypothetical protein